jgi:hypothetical protein
MDLPEIYFGVAHLFRSDAHVYPLYKKDCPAGRDRSRRPLYPPYRGRLSRGQHLAVALLAFSIFFFLSLALVKRYSELVVMRKTEGDKATARGYEISDAELLAAKGTASGYLAVFVLALYIASGRAEFLYGRHQLIWFLCPLMLYWIGRMWLVAHRGQMNDDPVLFATTDWTSRILILLMIVTTVLAL